MTTSTRRAFLASATAPAILRPQSRRRPNILFAIADDQSYPHTGAMGDRVVKTPHFDRVAERGVLFRNAFCPAPQCAPTRASLLTGRYIWQNEEAGTHASLFPKKFQVYPDLLAAAGYFTGLTGKGAGPCNWQAPGWPHNPAGPSFDERKDRGVPQGVGNNDYSANFADFLKARPKEKPFCFWYGCQEPHRGYKKGIGLESGKKLDSVIVPSFMPDTPEVRSDILDYYYEIEHFDRHLGRILDQIAKAGELENTLVVVTSDNGMAFPGAKATMYDYGWHLPLAISWPDRVPAGRAVDDLVSFIDFAPTYLEAAGLKPSAAITGRSLLPILESKQSGQVDASRDKIFGGRERHSHARYDNMGYPARAIRTHQNLYVRNFKPDRWPAGDPEGYHDIDASPTKSLMMDRRKEGSIATLFEHCFGKHGEEQLYDIKADPGCLKDLASSPAHEPTRKRLRAELDRTLTAQKDPRMSGSEIFDSYPRHSPMRPELGGFSAQGAYNPRFT
ncbi:MAG: sulfatase [Acidimicrobiia bacterium]|nr:sulfatase [Acidimicrobiia bacterium]